MCELVLHLGMEDQMRRRLVLAAVSVLALTLSVAAADAGSAHADPSACTIYSYSPQTVTVGLSAKKVTFSVDDDGCVSDSWSIESDPFFVYADSPDHVFWSSSNLVNSYAGVRDAVVKASDEDYNDATEVFSGSWDLKRATKWSKFNAAPEPVEKGSTLTLTSSLKIVDWDADVWKTYKGRSVAVQFKTPGGDYKTIKHVKTGKAGKVRTSVKATRTGTWRLSYGGTTIAGSSTSNGDTVKVKK